jgi:hypothetical protein
MNLSFFEEIEKQSLRHPKLKEENKEKIARFERETVEFV